MNSRDRGSVTPWPKMWKRMFCERKRDLIGHVQRTLSQLLELVHHQKEAVANGATNTVHSIDTQIELKIGEKERAMGALERHQQEHGC